MKIHIDGPVSLHGVHHIPLQRVVPQEPIDNTYQSADNLVDGLTKAEEEGYTYAHYYGSQKQQVYTENYKYDEF